MRLHKRPSEAPTLYPVACAPQAWAAGSVFLVLQSCLGMQIDTTGAVVRFTYPMLPESIPYVYIKAGYGTARTYAELLGDQAGAKLLQTTLEEERQTDQKLSKLAKSAINVAAAK